MTDAIACIRGCRQGGRHLSDCPGDECVGCQPRPVAREGGLLCWPCRRRLTEWLAAGENSLAHAEARLVEEIHAPVRATAYDTDRIQSSSEDGAPTPLNLARHDALAETRRWCAYWLQEWCHERGLHGPDDHGVKSATSYLHQWVDQLAGWERVGEMWDALAGQMMDAHALAPWRVQMRRCHGVPCPDCQRTSLVVFGGDDYVTCSKCGIALHRDVYAKWVAELAKEAS